MMLKTTGFHAAPGWVIRFGATVTAALAAAVLVHAPVRAQVTVTLAQGNDPEVLDPAYDTAIYSRSIMSNIYDTLVWRSAEGEVLPSLAESWKFVDDTTLQLNLRKGVKFHNGDPFTADDLIFTVDRYLDEKSRKPLRSYLVGLFKTVEKKDDYTVVLHLPKPNAAIFGDLARVPILPAKALTAMGDAKFGANPIGTGPFKFAKWDKNQQVVLEAFADHWRGRPSIDRHVIKPIPEDFGRFAALKTGQVDIVANLTPERVSEVEKDPKLKVLAIPSTRQIHIGMNTRTKPFDDVRVRQAMNYAVNVSEIIATVLGGRAYFNPAVCGKALFGHDPNVKPYGYDPATAKKLLAEAGYPNGFKTRLLTPTARYMKDREVSEAIAGQLAKVGVQIELVAPEWGDFIEQIFARGKYKDQPFEGVYQLGTGGETLDCDRTMLFRITTQAKGNHGELYYRTDKKEKIDALIEQQKVELDPAKRKELFGEIQAIVRDDAPWIFLYDLQDIYGVTKRIMWKPRPDEFIWAYDIKVQG